MPDTELFLLIVEDRHTGVDAWAYSTAENAQCALGVGIQRSDRFDRCPIELSWRRPYWLPPTSGRLP
jgi:hypothetical protein